MSDTSSIFTVFLLMLAASAFPGPSDLLVVAAALESGLRGSLRVLLGILLGDAVFILLATAGVHSLALMFPGSEQVLRAVGILILLMLGGHLLRSASRPETPTLPSVRPNVSQGFLITLADPTAIGFYAAVLPLMSQGQAVNPADGFRLFVCAACAIILVKSLYSFLALQIKERLLSPLLLSRIKRITAAGIILTAACIIFVSP